jgi:hypothetical protein
VSNALHRAVPFFDCFARAMEVEQTQACEPRCDDNVGRFAGEAAAGDSNNIGPHTRLLERAYDAYVCPTTR